VAERLAVPLEDAHRRDESVSGLLDRLLMSLVPLAQVYGGAPPEPMPVGDHSFREATEQVIAERAASGSAVILGRAAAVVLRDDQRACNVRLDGPAPRAAAPGHRAPGGSTGRPRSGGCTRPDRARDASSASSTAPTRAIRLYHLMIDSTALELDACVELVVLAARARSERAA
jgi:hypothetical protein